MYFFFAGHGVLAEHNEAYFVAHDSDPQNLHATALSFDEVDRTLSQRLRAALVVLVADACHTGRLGWSSYTPDAPSRAGEPLSKLGQGDRSFLKLLAARPSERSFERELGNDGHGVFTQVLLEGLGGAADRDGDRLIRASEAIDYLARLVPEQTESRQHPWVAGTFDARVVLASAPLGAPSTARPLPLDVSGPANTAVYLDNVFRGSIRTAGTLRVESLMPGPHRFSADFPDGTTLDGTVTLGNSPARVAIAPQGPGLLSRLRARLDSGMVLQPNGAWEFYRSQSFPGSDQTAATTLVTTALEELGQACVSDYVQSTDSGLKRLMLQRAVGAFERLTTLRPNDSATEVKKLFCMGRLQIAQGQLTEAVATLQESLKRDSQFACAYNALGVALSRLGRKKEARQAFETASKLTPEWALPPFQIALQLIASGDLNKARPYLEHAVEYNPRSVAPRWNLLHVDRLLRRNTDVERQATELIRLNPNYAPAYLELGLAYEADRNFAKAAEAYDTYVLLAPNFADSNAVRSRADSIRPRAQRPPSLIR